jgi:hypothetical protein
MTGVRPALTFLIGHDHLAHEYLLLDLRPCAREGFLVAASV